MGGDKRLFQLFYQTTLKTFTTLTSFNYFKDAFQIKPIDLSLKSALAKN